MRKTLSSSVKQRCALRKKLSRQSKHKDHQIFFDLPKGLFILALIMVSAQVLLSNMFGVKGAELLQLEDQNNVLAHQKTVLENKLSELSSLNRIEKECQANLQMQKVDKSIVYTSDGTLASAQ